jgi:FixJ family two-component response regulator
LADISTIGPKANWTTVCESRNNHFMAEGSPWIAVVDDDPAVLKALTRLLRTRAFHPKTYGSAQAFLTALSGGLPECLIIDLQMPEMTGLQLLQQLKRRDIQIPTIVITAHGDNGVRKACESAGALAFLSKPLQDTSLFAAIENANRTTSEHSPGPGMRADRDLA